MKHKVGDTVRIKSREWWDAESKNGTVYIVCGSEYFVDDMAKYCNKTATIMSILKNGYTVDIDNEEWGWTDEMFEEDAMDAKTEALEAVRRAEEELARAKKLLEQAEKGPRIGKLCKVWDGDIEPTTTTRLLSIITDIKHDDHYPIKTNRGGWENARLLTEEEKAKYL